MRNKDASKYLIHIVTPPSGKQYIGATKRSLSKRNGKRKTSNGFSFCRVYDDSDKEELIKKLKHNLIKPPIWNKGLKISKKSKT